SMCRPMTKGFIKREDCPSSFELVAFQTGELSRDRTDEVKLHLESCDFCDAEVDLYEHCPLGEPTIEAPAAIPAPLFELAEALLKGKHADGATLNALLKEKDGFALTSLN
ncbi:MAG TPA: hypothetical protein VL501_06805, partial [Pyrinomonadaceae bacterium]|nr:hypothetical protein [Pyrinomonadaceae bacterium]